MSGLSQEQLARHLASLPGWQVEGRELVRSFVFSSYREAVGFAVQVALLAERLDHHPDLLLSYKKVTVRCTTHSASGITEKDLHLAGQISAIAPAAPPSP
jgi:4a-hydroxytetrahydrobiopterin dehydratase